MTTLTSLVEKAKGVVGVDELIGVGFQFRAAGVVGLVGAAEDAAAVFPGVLNAPVADIAVWVVKGGADRILAVGSLGAVERTARHQPGQLGDGDAEELVFHNMVNPCLPVRDFGFQSLVQPLGDLAQEHARFAAGVEKAGIGIAPQLSRQQVQHLVSQLRRREHLIAGEVSQAGEHVRVVISHRRHGPPPGNEPADSPSPAPE